MATHKPLTAALLPLLLAVAIGAARLAAADDVDETSLDDNYAKCLCWNTTSDKMCAATSQESRDACERLGRSVSLYWAYVAAAIGVVLLFFPLFFALGRCCGCCGGRRPTYGCCCPHNELGRRRYSMGTVIAARLLVFLLFGALLAALIFTGVVQHRLGHALLHLRDDLRASAANISSVSATLNSSALNLSTIVAAPPATLSDDAASRLGDAADASEDAAQFVNAFRFLPALPLIVVAVAFVLGLCGVIGFPITCSAMIVCFTSSIFFFAVVAFGVAAQAAGIACGSSERFNVTRDFVRLSLDLDRVAADASSAEVAVTSDFMRYMCNDRGLAALCATGRFGTACSEALCSFDDATVRSAWDALPAALSGDGADWSIATCAGNPFDTDHTACHRVLSAYEANYGSVSAFSPRHNEPLNALVSGTTLDIFMADFCDSREGLRLRLRVSAGSVTYAAAVTLIGVCVLLFGAKRFRRGPHDTEVQPFIAGQPTDPLTHVDHSVAGIPIACPNYDSYGATGNYTAVTCQPGSVDRAEVIIMPHVAERAVNGSKSVEPF